jgi:hypothetical protein
MVGSHAATRLARNIEEWIDGAVVNAEHVQFHENDLL